MDADAAQSDQIGSSPRVRGPLLCGLSRHEQGRFIPASAGATMALSPCISRRRFIPASAGATIYCCRQGTGVDAQRGGRQELERSLRADQQAAFAHAIGAGRLKLIEGRPGTGKSFTLAAIRDAHEHDGKRVIGLAPTNAVAQDMAADGFTESSTVHAALFGLKNGRTAWDRSTVVVVDEAAMLDTRVTGELLAAAR